MAESFLEQQGEVELEEVLKSASDLPQIQAPIEKELEIKDDTTSDLTFQETSGYLAKTKEEAHEEELRLLDRTTEIESIGGGILTGDWLFNSSNIAGSIGRNMSNWKDNLDLKNTVDEEWRDNTDFNAVFDDYGFTNLDFIEELLTKYKTNPEAFYQRADQLSLIQESQNRMNADVKGSTIRQILSYTADPFLMYGAVKAYSATNALMKAKNIGVGGSFLAGGVVDATFAASAEGYVQYLNYRYDQDAIIVSAVFGGVLGSVGAGFLRKSQLTEESVLKATKLKNKEVIEANKLIVEANEKEIINLQNMRDKELEDLGLSKDDIININDGSDSIENIMKNMNQNDLIDFYKVKQEIKDNDLAKTGLKLDEKLDKKNLLLKEYENKEIKLSSELDKQLDKQNLLFKNLEDRKNKIQEQIDKTTDKTKIKELQKKLKNTFLSNTDKLKNNKLNKIIEKLENTKISKNEIDKINKEINLLEQDLKNTDIRKGVELDKVLDKQNNLLKDIETKKTKANSELEKILNEKNILLKKIDDEKITASTELDKFLNDKNLLLKKDKLSNTDKLKLNKLNKRIGELEKGFRSKSELLENKRLIKLSSELDKKLDKQNLLLKNIENDKIKAGSELDKILDEKNLLLKNKDELKFTDELNDIKNINKEKIDNISKIEDNLNNLNKKIKDEEAKKLINESLSVADLIKRDKVELNKLLKEEVC